MAFKLEIFRVCDISKFELVGHARTTGSAHTQLEADAAAALG
jgi:hypothetical protein